MTGYRSSTWDAHADSGKPRLAHLLPTDRSEATPQLSATAEADQPSSATAVSTAPHRDREGRMWPVVRNASGFVGSALGTREKPCLTSHAGWRLTEWPTQRPRDGWSPCAEPQALFASVTVAKRLLSGGS
jgi:hypothetical protein